MLNLAVPFKGFLRKMKTFVHTEVYAKISLHSYHQNLEINVHQLENGQADWQYIHVMEYYSAVKRTVDRHFMDAYQK